MIEIDITNNLQNIGWIILALVHVLFIFWFSWGIPACLKNGYDRAFDLSFGVILPAVLLIFIWLGVLSGLGHIVWL